jgi:hypothetical protein
MNYTRKGRGKTQSIFLIEMNSQFENSKTFVVMGTTGNVYKVTIKSQPECTCPDYQQRANRCKHIFFILIRVMHVTSDNEDKEEYTDAELKTMFASMPKILNHLIADSSHRTTYNKLKDSENKNKDNTVAKKGTDDVCPICLDDLENSEELDYCKYSCGKPIHKMCFTMWCKKNDATCVFCRESWVKIETDFNNYINLIK